MSYVPIPNWTFFGNPLCFHAQNPLDEPLSVNRAFSYQQWGKPQLLCLKTFDHPNPSKPVVKHGHLGWALEWNQPTIQPSPASSHHLFWGMILSFFFALNHERITWFPKSCGVSLQTFSQLSLPTKWHDYSPIQCHQWEVFFETSLTADRWVSRHQQEIPLFCTPELHGSGGVNSLAFNFNLVLSSQHQSFRQHWPWASFLEWFCTIRKHKNHFCFSEGLTILCRVSESGRIGPTCDFFGAFLHTDWQMWGEFSCPFRSPRGSLWLRIMHQKHISIQESRSSNNFEGSSVNHGQKPKKTTNISWLFR